MIKTICKIIFSIGLAIVLTAPGLALGMTEVDLNESNNSAIKKLYEIGANKGPYAVQQESGISNIVGAGVEAVLALIGVVFLILMIYAGYNWMTARGEEEKVEKAKDTITRAFIGLIIVVGAYAIWSFVFNQFILK